MIGHRDRLSERLTSSLCLSLMVNPLTHGSRTHDATPTERRSGGTDESGRILCTTRRSTVQTSTLPPQLGAGHVAVTEILHGSGSRLRILLYDKCETG